MLRAPLLTPVIIAVVAAFVALAGTLTLWLAGHTPWLGTTLVPFGDVVVIERGVLDDDREVVLEAVGLPQQPPVPVTALDLLAEPDTLNTFAELNAFHARQDRLFALLGEPQLTLYVSTDGEPAVALSAVPHLRPYLSLPPSFWIQFLTGIVSALIAGWVWALRPRQLAPSLFALSGMGVLLVTMTSAYYAHRGLALPSTAYAWLLPLNHFGVLLFGSGMMGLFLIYPRRLVRKRWLLAIPLLTVPLFLADTTQMVTEATQYGTTTLLMTVAILMLIVAQWWATRNAPTDRAVLGWLGLSVAVALSVFALLSLAPALMGFNSPLAQHYAAGAVVIIYVGLAFGLRRYRLFELGEWSYRILFYTFGAFLLLVLDAGLLALLNLDVAPAFATALLLIAVAYLPLRDWLWQRLFGRDRIAQHELFSAAMDVAFAPSRMDSAARWQTLLKRLFDPLETRSLDRPPDRPLIAEDGLVLDLPPVAGAPGLRLYYPFGGTGLFQPGHLSLATNLVRLTESAEESRQAYMRGVGEERRRMARDLHDDVGARLLTGLHTADERTRPTLQAALSDIRAIVSGLAGDEAELSRVLAEIRHEAARRLEAAEIEFDCPLPETDAPGIQLDYRIHKALTSAVREIVSNVIRHSGATRLAVTTRLEDGRLVLHFADDGKGLPAEAIAGETAGYGLKSLRQRVADLGGGVALGNAAGTCITLDVPLTIGARTPEPGVQPTAGRLDSPS